MANLLTGSVGRVLLLCALYLLLAMVIWMEARELAHATSPRSSPVGPQRKARTPRRLVLLEGVGPGQIELKGAETLLGRDPSCHITLPDSSVSYRHARVFQSDGEWFVEDLGSTNATYLNDRALTRPAQLRAGDKIAVGRSILEVRT